MPLLAALACVGSVLGNMTLFLAARKGGEAFLEKEGQAFLERVDEWLSRHEAPPADGGSKTRSLRVGAGVYGIQDEPKP